MKKYSKRVLSLLLAVLTLFTTLFSGSAGVLAASAKANIQFYYASAKEHGVISEYKSSHKGNILYGMIDGHVAYCMNYGLSADGGQLMLSDVKPKTNLSEKKEKLLAYCMYHGFSSTATSAPGNAQKNKYVATQAMVWNIVQGLWNTADGDSAAKKLCDCAPDPSTAKSYYSTLRTKIDNSYNAKRPSFASKTKSDAETVSLEWNEANKRYEHTFKDANKVLADFKIDIDGYKVECDGNTMVVSSKEVKTSATTGKFTSNSGAVEVTSSSVFWVTGKSGYQEFVSVQPQADPISAYIKVKTESNGYGELTKTDRSTGKPLKGAVYGIYSDSACKKQVDTMTTNASGYAKSKALPAGTYYVKEITAPAGYVISDKVHTLIVKAGKTTGISAVDSAQKGALTIYKEGEVLTGWDGKNFIYKKQKLAGVGFKVTAGSDIKAADGTKVFSKGDVVQDGLVTDSEGKVFLSDLNLGTYVITETKSLDGFCISEKSKTVTIDNSDQTVEVKAEYATVFNERQRAKVSVKKEDAKSGAALAGAEFGLYADSDIKNVEGKVIVSKGTLLSNVKTGEDGVSVFNIDLPAGNGYSVKELKAPKGYILNKTDVYQFVFGGVPATQTNVEYHHVFKNDKQLFEFSILKLDHENEKPLSGAVFKLCDENGTELETATSNEEGKVVFKGQYPVGKYFAKEIKAPMGYVLSDEVVIFDAAYQGQDKEIIQMESTVTNKPTVFEFSKEDITSGAELDGAKLTVIDKDGNQIDSWTSVANEKHVIKRLAVGETYRLHEELAPYGYLVASDIEFKVENTDKIQGVVMKDEVAKGAIIINKDGEFLSGVGNAGGASNTTFIYDKDSLSGVTFEVHAREDIVSMDGLMTTYFKADDLVGTIVTDETGVAKIEDLPLGKYYLVETKTVDGFVLDQTPVDVELAYADQNTSVVYAGIDVTNERQRVQVTVIKKDSETKNVLEGATFGLYAKEDINAADGTVIVPAGSVLETAVTNAEGKAGFVTDLPLGQYYVKEIKAPDGYVKNDEIFDVDASYKGDDVKVIEVSAEFENAPIKVEISKTDITGEKELEGAKLSVIDQEGNVIESWTSEAGKTHMIERLSVGKYVLREESAPYGYKIAKDVEFEVTETADVQKVVMKDEYAVGKIVIEKKDSESMKPIAGVEFEIRDKDGKVIEKLVTDEKGHAESKELPICIYNEDGSYKEDIHYYVVETKTAEGYILDETVNDIVLKYDDAAPECVVYILEVTNRPTIPKLPQTGDDYNPWVWAGIGTACIALAGVTMFFRKKGEDKFDAEA